MMRTNSRTTNSTTIIIINQFETTVSMEIYLSLSLSLPHFLVSLKFSMISTQLRCIYFIFSFFIIWSSYFFLPLILNGKASSYFLFLFNLENGLDLSVYIISYFVHNNIHFGSSFDVFIWFDFVWFRFEVSFVGDVGSW